MARTEIDLYEADARALGGKLDWLAGLSDGQLLTEKIYAHALGQEDYSMEAVRQRWEEVLVS
jgi:hypothetical protein